MWFGRLIGWGLIAAALVALGGDAVASLAAGALVLEPLGALWFKADPGSLNLAQAVVQRYVSAWLWDPAIQWVLRQPTVVVAAILGAAFLWFCRVGGPRRPRRRSSFD